MRFRIIATGLFIILATCRALVQQPSNGQAAAQAAEQVGRLRDALTHYVAALKGATEGSEADLQLRKEIIGVAKKLKPAPSLPEEARRHLVVGNTYVKDAKSAWDYREAIAEYKSVLLLAPWFGEAYNNLGVALEAAGDYSAAEKELKLYLETQPNPADARVAQDRIYEIEAKASEQERAQRETREQEEAKRRAAEEKERKQQVLQAFRNKAGGLSFDEYDCMVIGSLRSDHPTMHLCNLEEYKGTNWHRADRYATFQFPDDGTIVFCGTPSNKQFQQCPIGGFPIIVGTIHLNLDFPADDLDLATLVSGGGGKYPSSYIVWRDSNGKRFWMSGLEKFWMSLNLGSEISFTISPGEGEGARPLDNAGFDPNRRYFYQMYEAR